MAKILDTDYTSEYIITPQTSIWKSPTDTTPTIQNSTNSFHGSNIKVLPTTDGVYTFVGQPGAKQPNSVPSLNSGEVWTNWEDNAEMYGAVRIRLSKNDGYHDFGDGAEELVILPGTAWEGAPSNIHFLGDDYDWSTAAFGASIAAISYSDGIYFAVSAPGAKHMAGRVFLFHSNSSGISLVDDSELMTGNAADPNYYNVDATMASGEQDSRDLVFSQDGNLYWLGSDKIATVNTNSNTKTSTTEISTNTLDFTGFDNDDQYLFPRIFYYANQLEGKIYSSANTTPSVWADFSIETPSSGPDMDPSDPMYDPASATGELSYLPGPEIGYPFKLAHGSNYLVFTDEVSSIRRVDKTTKQVTIIHSNLSSAPVDIGLVAHSQGNYSSDMIFWTDKNGILWSSMVLSSGSEPIPILVASGVTVGSGIHVDKSSGKIYWVSANGTEIRSREYSSNAFTSNEELVFTAPATSFISGFSFKASQLSSIWHDGVTLDESFEYGGTLFWADSLGDKEINKVVLSSEIKKRGYSDDFSFFASRRVYSNEFTDYCLYNSSIRALSDKPSEGISLAFDDTEENLYISIYDSNLKSYYDRDGGAAAEGIRVFRKSATSFTELPDIPMEDIPSIYGLGSAKYRTINWGAAHEMIFDDGKLYFAASHEPCESYGVPIASDLIVYSKPSDMNIATSLVSFSPDEDSSFDGVEHFGTGNPDIIKGADGIYILMGSPHRHDLKSGENLMYSGLGRLYLFKYDGSTIAQDSFFTGSDDASEYGVNYFGENAHLASGSDGFLIVSRELANTHDPGPHNMNVYSELTNFKAASTSKIWIYEKGDTIDKSYYIEETTAADTEQTGKTLDAKLYSDTLYIMGGDPEYNDKSGETTFYKWNLVPRSVATVAIGGGTARSFEIENASIQIPATALASSTDVTVEKKSIDSITAEGDTEVSDLGLSSDVVVMTPHGLTFDEPVTVTLTVDSMPENPVVYYQSSPGSAWEVFSGEITIEGNTVSFQINSFSSYGVGEQQGGNNMACELSSSFSKENRLQPSTQLWNELNGTYRTQLAGHSFGTATRVVPYNNDVYTFVGMPGSQKDWQTNDTADHQGSVYIYRSGSSGFDTELIIGPGGTAAPLGGATPSNYTGINLGGEDWNHANLGKSIDSISSSAGLHFLVAAPGLNQLAGRIFLFQSSSSGIQIVDDSNIMSGSSSDPYWGNSNLEGQRSQDYSQAGTMKSSGDWSQSSAINSAGYGSPNDAVSLVFDDNEENLYISFYDSLLSDSVATDNAGGIRLYKSSSLGGVEHLEDIIVSSPITNEQVGSAHQMIVSDGKVYIAASAYGFHRDPGQAYLFTYDIDEGTYTEDIYYPDSSFSDPDGEVHNECFGSGTPDIVSGSDGIYILQGSAWRHDRDPYTVYGGLGRLYLFKSSSLGGIEVDSVFTGSNDAHEYGWNFFGGEAQIMSGNSGLVIVSSEYSGALVGPDSWGTASPRIWVYETGSNINTSYYIGTDNSTENFNKH